VRNIVFDDITLDVITVIDAFSGLRDLATVHFIGLTRVETKP